MMGCSDILRRYSRYLLVFFNVIFSITGIVIISVGISAKAFFHEFDTFLNDKYIYLSDLLIIVGAIIFVIAFFGCCGAIKENSCMTTTFSTLLIVVFVLEIVASVSGVLLKNRTEEFLFDTLNTTIKQYENNVTEIVEIWNKVQSEYHCCGINSSEDWLDNGNSTLLPLSCCPIPSGRRQFSCTAADAYQPGCLQEFGKYIRGHTTTIEGVGIGLAIIQVLGILLACYLAKAIRSDYETV